MLSSVGVLVASVGDQCWWPVQCWRQSVTGREAGVDNTRDILVTLLTLPVARLVGQSSAAQRGICSR